MDKIISLKNINKIYGTYIKTQVLFDINLDIEKSSFSSIIGQSGSGKSTLLNITGTLDKPTSGDIIIDEINTKNMNKNQLSELRNQKLGFIFQFHYLLPEFTAYENVLMPYLIKNKPLTDKQKERAYYLLDMVGLSKVKNNPASRMSGGQQQRTAIARALFNNPPIILADEPTGNLDSDSSKTVFDMMRDINKEYGTTFLVITHDRRIADKTDRIIEIKDGKINLDLKNGGAE
ncbi:MAG: ABC transporter ATP-binding protein [Thermotogae bacterium]|nr:ABC transporter ATP-binding protein [Thermotogota bacterium]MCP5465075.1 ABC transporter ATP-binding protein [Thermotogota bacterium]HOO75764.1 ABC transporter ATP-binding protein [Tepiditoga sp.]